MATKVVAGNELRVDFEAGVVRHDTRKLRLPATISTALELDDRLLLSLNLESERRSDATVECVVAFERLVRSKAVGIDGERLLLAVGQQESNRRFVCGFRRDHVLLSSTAISENEHGWSVAIVRTTPTRGPR